MTSEIGFVANFHMTETFLGVARLLEARGYRTHWFSFSRRWSRWLSQHGVRESQIVSLNFEDLAEGRERVGPGLPDVLRKPWEPSLLEALEGDRVLRQRPLGQAVDGIVRASARFQEELAARRIAVVFGEATWASEVSLAYAARAVGVPYLAPHMVRYPAMRFGFFFGPTQAELLDLGLPATGEEMQVVKAAVDLFVAEASGPGLWAHNRADMDRFLRERQLLFEKVLLGLRDSAGNPTQMRLPEYLRSKNPVTLRRRTDAARRIMRDALVDSSQAPGKYVLMPLQVQPEASVDVLAWTARDQVENVRRMADAVGPDCFVGVKEHSHQFGSRARQDYEAMLEHRNVFLIDPAIPSEPWRSGALAVATPTGTMALENALRGGTSIVFTRMFFDRLPNVHAVSVADAAAVRAALTSQPVDSLEALEDYFSWVVCRSSPGLFSNPRTTPGVLDDNNVAALATGFDLAVNAAVDAANAGTGPSTNNMEGSMGSAQAPDGGAHT